MTGEHFRFRSAPEDDTVLAFDFRVDPGGGVDRVHRHRAQSEVMRCTAGELTVTIDGATRVLRPGDEVRIEPGALHAMANEGEVPAVCAVEYRPAGRNRAWFQLISAFQAKTGREPGLLDLGAFIGDVGIFVAKPPIPVQRALFAVLRPVATVLGRRQRMLRWAREVHGDAFAW
jgi:quercetin dioxygenase-like cupin family protein